MSSIGAMSALSAMSLQISSRAMFDAAAADEGDTDGDLMVESENDVEIESDSEHDDDADDGNPASSLGGQIDAWG